MMLQIHTINIQELANFKHRFTIASSSGDRKGLDGIYDFGKMKMFFQVGKGGTIYDFDNIEDAIVKYNE